MYSFGSFFLFVGDFALIPYLGNHTVALTKGTRKQILGKAILHLTLDGTAKGGIVIAIARELGVPVKLVGMGEGLDDLKPFDAADFAQALI